MLAPPSLTQHGGLFEELVAGLEGHLLQGRGVGADGVAVQRLVNPLEAHVVRYQRQVPGVHLDSCKHTRVTLGRRAGSPSSTRCSVT